VLGPCCKSKFVGVILDRLSSPAPIVVDRAKGNSDAVFTAIHPNFYPDAAPYLLTGVDLPPTNPKVDRGSGVEMEQALAKKSSDQTEKFVSSERTGAKERPSTAGTTDIIPKEEPVLPGRSAN
jgi:hypothetical protein